MKANLEVRDLHFKKASIETFRCWLQRSRPECSCLTVKTLSTRPLLLLCRDLPMQSFCQVRPQECQGLWRGREKLKECGSSRRSDFCLLLLFWLTCSWWMKLLPSLLVLPSSSSPFFNNTELVPHNLSKSKYLSSSPALSSVGHLSTVCWSSWLCGCFRGCFSLLFCSLPATAAPVSCICTPARTLQLAGICLLLFSF